MRCLLLAGLLLLSCANSPRADPAADQEAIEAVLEAQRVAWNAGDLTGYMDGYLQSDDLVFTSGAEIRRGWETARASYEKRYGGDTEGMGHLEFEVLEVRVVGDDAAVVLGKWFLTETENAGEGVFSLVVERTPSGWKVSHDHTSALAKSDPPPSPQKPPEP